MNPLGTYYVYRTLADELTEYHRGHDARRRPVPPVRPSRPSLGSRIRAAVTSRRPAAKPAPTAG